MKSWVWAVLGGTVWLGLVVTGLALMFVYQTKPGLTAEPPEHWPVESALQRTSDKATLIMTVHPQCPCTRASIGELALLMASCQGKVQAHVLFYKPEASPESWEKTDLWANAARIPGVQALRDVNGTEARRFQASTSGQTILYDQAGRLQFSGGITAGRGHSGENAGRAAIVALLTKGITSSEKTHVYGCSLFESNPTSFPSKVCCQK